MIEEYYWILVKEKLSIQWSPEQFAHYVGISTESIYRYIYKDKSQGGQLYRHLRCQKKKKKQYAINDSRGCIKNPVRIDDRPKVVEERTRLGDWKVDTIIGKAHQQAIVSLVERKSGYTRIQKVIHKTAELVSESVIQLLTNMPVFTI
ncbi:IS30 family transposase, partial [Neisseriaceae bacterium PsAf]|nr:IS30 family transposase [Neisseriaceae bacterium PsAf]